MSETKIKKLNLKALQSNGKESIKEEVVTSITKESASTPKSTLGDSANIPDTSTQDASKKHLTKKISIASIKKAPVKKDVPKKETTQNTDGTPHNSKEDKEKNIMSSSKMRSSEIENSKNNNTSVNRDIKKDTTKLVPQASNKNPHQEKNITVDTNKLKNNVNEKFKEEVLSENKQQEIIEKTLKEEKRKKKGIFSRIFSRKKKTHATKKEPSNKTKEENKEIHFENYTSDFEKKSRNILKRVQNFKYAPKTRKGLVIGLVSLTFLIIGGLMILFPEKHSLAIYKASILEMTYKQTEPLSTQENNKPQTITQPESNIIVENPISKEESDETSQNTTISQEEQNKEKLRNYLLGKYKK